MKAGVLRVDIDVKKADGEMAAQIAATVTEIFADLPDIDAIVLVAGDDTNYNNCGGQHAFVCVNCPTSTLVLRQVAYHDLVLEGDDQ